MFLHYKNETKSREVLTRKEKIFGMVAIVAAIPIMGTLLAQNTFAYTMLDGQASIEEQKNVIDRFGNSPIKIAASCEEIDDVLYAVGNYPTNIFLEDNCQSNIVIGTGKNINLIARYYKDSSAYYETLANMNTNLPGMESLKTHSGEEFNNYVDGRSYSRPALTVESGATVIIDGFIRSLGGVTIENYGTLLLMGGALGPVKNHGALYLGGGNYGDVDFQIDDGSKFKIVDGWFPTDKAEFVRQNTADGVVVSVSDEWNGVKVTMPLIISELFEDVFIPVAIDVDMPYTMGGVRYPEIADALLIKVTPSFEGVIEASGSMTTGIKLRGISQNTIGLWFTNNLPIFSNGNNIKYQEVISYKLSGDVSDARRKRVNDVINEQLGETFHGYIAETEIKAALLGVGAMNITFNEHELDRLGVSQEDLEKLEALSINLGSTLVKYFDLSASLVNSETLSKLMSLTDLGDNDGETFSIDIPEDLMDTPEGKTRTFQVYRVHEDEAEMIPSNRNGNKIVFTTSKFSTYALGYEDINAVKAPNTGLFTKEDGSSNVENILFSIAGLSVIAFVTFSVSSRIRKYQKVTRI